jgi:hypothetical protein
LGNFYFFSNVNSTIFWKIFQIFYIENFEKENLVTMVEVLGKGYQMKWPLGTDWELWEHIGSVSDNHCWEHNGNMVPTVTGTLKISPAPKQNNCSQVFTQRLRISGYDRAVIRNGTL